MLYYDTNDASEGVDINKISATKECNIVTNSISYIKSLSFKNMHAMAVMTY